MKTQRNIAEAVETVILLLLCAMPVAMLVALRLL